MRDVLRSPGQPLTADARGFFEPRFGRDFSNVRIHADRPAADSASAVHALAYTVGSSLVFAAGRYQPGTNEGRAILAHELAHVVQQTSSPSISGVAPLEIDPNDSPAEREAAAAAAHVLAGTEPPTLQPARGAVQRLREPYIKQVSVNLTPSQSAALSWQGTPPATPGRDSFTVSTGKGYRDPEDERDACTRACCTDPDKQCAPPNDEPARVGACCTPVGSNFWTGKPRSEHNGWLYWTPVEPVHTKLGRGIALHQHDTVTGEAIGHGCIRMEEENAHRIYLYSRGTATNVTISGSARVYCPTTRRCGVTGAAEGAAATEELATAAPTRPDEEEPGGGGAPAEEAPAVPESAVA